MRSVCFCVAGIVILLCCSALGLQKLTGGRISGSVFDNTGAVVPGTELTFRTAGNAEAKSVISGIGGSYTVELPTGEYYVLSERGNGFCAFKRGAFRVDAGANANLNIRIQPCGITHYITKTPTGEGSEFAESSPRQNYDAFVIRNARSKVIKLTVRFAERQKQNSTLTYTAVGHGEDKAPVVVSFDLISIVADKVTVNVDDSSVAAEGNVIVDDGKHSAKKSGAKLRFHKGEPVLTCVPQ